MASRMQNAKRNIVSGLILRVVNILLPFVTRTALIYCLGALYLGLNSLYGSILNVLSLAELGFGSAMVFSMYGPLARNETDTICALLKLYRKIYRIIGCVVLGIGLIIMPFLSKIIKGEVPVDINIYWLYLLFLGNSTISYFLFAYKQSLLTADQRSDILNVVNSILAIVSTSIQLCVLLVFKNYYLYCIVWPIFTILNNVLINYIVNKRYPDYFCKGVLEKEETTEIKKRVAGLFLYKVCYTFRDNFGPIMISAFIGLTELAKYNNYWYIITAITGCIVILSNSITAGVGNSMATESEKKNYNDFRIILLLYVWLSIWCTVCLACLFQPFISLWIGNDYLFGTGLMLLFCLQFYCSDLGDTCALYRRSAGLWWQDRYRPVVEAVVSLVLSFVLIKRIGVAGVLLANIFCQIFINSFWASWVLFKYYFKDYKQSYYIYRILFYLALGVLTVAVTYYICQVIPLEGIWLLVVRGAVCIVLPNLIIYPFLKMLPEFQDALFTLKRVIKK